jgi:spermidine/putrescine transport system substrate-binding protein
MALGGLAACGSRQSRLNVFNWSDYIARDTLPAFERETGVRVRYGLYESAEEMVARVMSGNSGWDVVFPPNSVVRPMAEMGLLALLDPSQLPNLVNLDARFRPPRWDVRYAVPYMWGATGIVYQRSLQPPVTGWGDLWSPRLRGRVTMLDDPAEVLAACLKRAGKSVNSSDPAELAAAKRDAIAQKPYLRAYMNASARDQLVAGDLLAAQAWRVTAQQAIDSADGRLAFCYPSEGFPLYADCVAILRESARPELAHRFLDYLLRPSVAAAIALEMSTEPCNRGARELLPPSRRDNPVAYPPEETLARGEWFAPVPAAGQKLRDRLWTEIKTA